MIGSVHRFHGHNSLRDVYQRGLVARNPQCLLRYTPSNRQSGYRAAVVVSRKVHKSAVKRNRIRRRIYSLVTKQASYFQKPYDLVFTVFDAQLATLPATELSELVSGLLLKAGVIKEPAAPQTRATIVGKAAKEA